MSISASPTGDRNVIEFPLVLDNQQDPFDVNSPSLADIESSGYRLRRIVGKIWCILSQTSPDVSINTALAVVVTAGIMVRKAITETGASTASQISIDEIHPGVVQNTGDPWVWRRSWVLGNQFATGAFVEPSANVFVPLLSFPKNNFGKEYPGGIAEGPHVDQKTARIVGPEERLFLDIGTTVLLESPESVGLETLSLAVFTDLRVLGSLRTSSGNRRNASR